MASLEALSQTLPKVRRKSARIAGVSTEIQDHLQKMSKALPLEPIWLISLCETYVSNVEYTIIKKK
jgi:hypothetical protein